MCGDDGVLLHVRKHDFFNERKFVDCKCPRNLIITDLRSISFYDDLRGACVGELGTILVTENSGDSWERIKVEAFDTFNFNRVIYTSPTTFYIGGDAGLFVEMKKDISGWTAYRRRISKFIDDEDEYLLVDNINDLFYTCLCNFSKKTQLQIKLACKEILFLKITSGNSFIIMGTYLKDCFVNYKQKFDKTSHLNPDFVYNNKCFRNVNVILRSFPSAFYRF